MLGTRRELEEWEVEIERLEAEGLLKGGFEDNYPDPDLAAQLVQLELNLEEWLIAGHREVATSMKAAAEDANSGNHTGALAEALRQQHILGCIEGLNVLAQVLDHLTEDAPVEGPLFKRDDISKEHLRQQAVHFVGHLNEMLLRRQELKARSSTLLS